MKTLLALFDEGRGELQQRLDAAERLQEVVSITQQELDQIQKRHLGGLTVPQARVVSPMVAVLRVTVGALAAANKTRVWHEAPGGTRRSEKAPYLAGAKLKVLGYLTGVDVAGILAGINLQVLKVRILQWVICLGLVVGLLSLTRETWTAWPAMLLIVSLVLLEAFGMPRARGLVASGQPDVAGGPKVTVGVDPKMLLDGLASALDTIDRAVPDPAGRPEAPGDDQRQQEPIEAVIELLEVIQDLLGESLRDDAQLTLKRSKQLPAVLARYGVKVVSHEPSEADWFDPEPSLDPNAKDWKTLKPALIKDDRVLLRGRVVTPAGGGG